MKRFPYWTQISTFILTTLIIVWLMPRTSTST